MNISKWKISHTQSTVMRSFMSMIIFVTFLATASPIIPSYYSGALSSSSGMFIRPNITWGSFYYQAIQVTVHTGGTYTFTSNSSMDTFGCFYSNSFDPFNSSQNLITYDDDSGVHEQFWINVTLGDGGIYVLVVTTFIPDTTGTFSIIALGPASVSLIPLTPTTSK